MSVFSSLKQERIKKRIYQNRAEATADVSDESDNFYKGTLRRSYCGGVNPVQFASTH